MKLKEWLKTYKNMSYSEYKNLSEDERLDIQIEHQRFNRAKQIHDSQNWRPMTEEEKHKAEEFFKKERERYEKSLISGGIDSRGNYTALHHRGE